MSASSSDTLVRMANQIADFFKIQSENDAVAGTADHIKKFWDPLCALLDHMQAMEFMRTGLDVQENQARRLLNDIASFRGYLEQKSAHPVPESVAANRWLSEVYDPVVNAIPPQLRGRLAPAEIFHEILLHRWYLSETAGHDVGTSAAAQSYFRSVLPDVPEQFTSGDVASASERRLREASDDRDSGEVV